MATIGGSFSPGQATGYAAPFPQQQAPGPIDYGGSGGYLNKLMRMKEKMAKVQLQMMQEQLKAFKKSQLKGPDSGLKRGGLSRAGPEKQYMMARAGAMQGGPRFGEMGFANLARRNDALMNAGQLAAMMGGGQGGSGGISDMTRGGEPGIAQLAQQQRIAELAGQPRFGGPDINTGGPAGAGSSPFSIAGGIPAYNQGIVGAAPNQGQMAGTQIGGSPGNYYQIKPGLEEGTLPGTVPKTGTTKVHRGEVVIPEGQVDPPLLRYLTEDAMNKGMLKSGAAAGYGCGSLKKGYQPGSLMDDPALLEYQRQQQALRQARDMGKVPGSTAMIPHPGAIPGASSALAPQGGSQAWQSPGLGAGPGGPAGYKTTAGIGPDKAMMQEWDDMVRAAAPKERKQLMAGLVKLQEAVPIEKGLGGMGTPGAPSEGIGAALGRVKTMKGPTAKAAKEAVEEIVKAAEKTPQGRKWLAIAGIGALGVAALIPPGEEEEDRSGWDLAQQILATTLPPVSVAMGAIRGQEDPFGEWGSNVARNLQAVGGALRETVGKAGVGLAGQLGLGMAPGEELEDAADKEKTVITPPEPTAEPEVPPERDLRAEMYSGVRELPEQKHARHKAQMAEASATNLMTMLGYGGVSQDARPVMEQQVQKLLGDAKKWTAIAQGREKAGEEELKQGAKLASDILRLRERDLSMEERQINVAQSKADRTSELIWERQRASVLRDAHKTYMQNQSVAARNRALNVVAQTIMTYKKDMSPERATEIAVDLMGATPEQMEAYIAELEK